MLMAKQDTGAFQAMRQEREQAKTGPASETARKEALRLRTLARLVGMEPADSAEAQRAVVARLAKALRGERRRGQAGHWTYDLNRHIALMQAYRAERTLLARPDRRGGAKHCPPTGKDDSASRPD